MTVKVLLQSGNAAPTGPTPFGEISLPTSATLSAARDSITRDLDGIPTEFAIVLSDGEESKSSKLERYAPLQEALVDGKITLRALKEPSTKPVPSQSQEPISPVGS